MKKLLLSILCLLGIALAGNAQTENLLSNSSFEEWSDSKPTDWATLATSNATIEQSTDAHSGTYSVVVKGASSSNKRFASKSYTLAAGTYTMSAFVKANGEEAGYYRLGYVKLDNGTAVSNGYTYSEAAATAAPTDWTEVTNEFTLDAETELAILVMNNKLSEGASFLIDDFTLTLKEEGGDNTNTPDTTTVSTIADVIAAGAGTAAVKGTIVATYARGFLVNDGTGYILTYLGSTPANTVGDVVTVSGTTSLYGGLLQFGTGATVEKDGTATVTHPTAGVMSAADMDAYVLAPTIKYVEYTGTLTINGNFYNVAVDGATAIGSISYPNDGLVTAASGDKVKVTGYTIGSTGSSTKYVNTMALSVEVVEAATPDPEEPASEVYIEESFASDLGDFTQAQTVGTYEWEIAYSTARITAYVDSVNNAAEAWLISPSVDFTEETQAYIQFEYIIRFAEEGKVADNHQLLVSKNFAGDPATATWTAIDFNATEGSDWSTFSTASVNIPEEFMGESELTFAFKYISTTKAGTWEVRNLIVAHGEAEVTEEPEVPEPIECTVTEALAAYVDGEQIPAIVTGYIVGAMNATGYVAEFGDTTSVQTNILLSDNGEETNIENCIIVQLPGGSDIRTVLNLADNPGNYKKQVKITGSIEKYFQQAGLKNPTAYEFTGVTNIDKVLGEEDNAVKVIYDLTGRRVENITKSGIYIVNGKKVLVK